MQRWEIYEDRIRVLEAENTELREAVKAMFAACDEWAAEFTQKKRAMNWGVVNDAYVKAEKSLKGCSHAVSRNGENTSRGASGDGKDRSPDAE